MKVWKVYLAAAFHRQKEMRNLALDIELMGIDVTSRWLLEHLAPIDPEARENFYEENAIMDMADVKRCDILVRFSDDLACPFVPSEWCTASRMEESGMATAWNKQIVVVGGKQSLFDRLFNRVHLKDKTELLKWLEVNCG